MRRGLGAVYWRLLSPFGTRALGAMVEDGLPPSLAAPLRTLFALRLPADLRAAAAIIERRRAVLAAGTDRFRFEYDDSTVGAVHWLERADGGDISSHRLAMSASVRPRWGAF